MRIAIALAVATVGILGGCNDFGRDDPEPWYAERPSVLYSANGFTWGVYGPWPHHIRDDWGSLIAGLVTADEVGAALEVEARALAFKYGFDPEAVLTRARGIQIDLVDDYVMDGFGTGSQYVSGMTDSARFVRLALWTRKAGTADPSSVPTGVWISRPPSGNTPYWRYTGLRLVPAARHEFGHVWTGDPGFEH
jgi:hypothetical protein